MRSGTTGSTVPQITVSPGATGSGALQINVRSSTYTVMVSAFDPAWVQANVPGQTNPIFAHVLDAGQTQSLQPVSGTLSLNIGASKVSVQVTVGGKVLTGWSYTPTQVPYTLDFLGTSQS